MNKLGSLLLIAAFCSFSSVFALDCKKHVPDNTFPDNEFADMGDKCVEATEEQIKMEIRASLKYLKMGAYFAKDSVNRPGFAKLFFDAASEEREHAYKLIEYLSMRGRYLSGKGVQSAGGSIPNINIFELVKEAEADSVIVKGEQVNLAPLTPDLSKSEKTTSGLIALQNALKLEKVVTESIRGLVKSCEGEPFNHYHFVDYLTGEFLDEQYKGQRDLAGKVSTLAKMVSAEGSMLADFLFDKQLL